ncbi:MAG: rhodanese-like domain-containing protein, partial [Gammaproteobacteria bacterium]
ARLYSCFSRQQTMGITIMKKLLALTILVFLATGWTFLEPDYVKSISPAQLNEIMQKEDIFLVDVHTPEQRHIQGTDAFIPYDNIENYQSKLPTDKNTPIYLYCEGGPMGIAAAMTLHDLGYSNLLNLEGGSIAWRKAGFDFE